MQKFIVLIVSLFLFSCANLFAQGDVTTTIDKFIQEKYPRAITIDIDNDKTKIEVEIVHDGREKDLLFNSRGQWQSTSFEMLDSELPRVIEEALKDSSYSSYSIEDIDFYETPKQSYYKIELEKWFSDDVTVYISTDGKFF